MPQPRGLTVIVNVGSPLIKLEIADASCTTMDWINGGRIVCGTSTGKPAAWSTDQVTAYKIGCIIAWDVIEALRDPSIGPRKPCTTIAASGYREMEADL